MEIKYTLDSIAICCAVQGFVVILNGIGLWFISQCVHLYIYAVYITVKKQQHLYIKVEI